MILETCLCQLLLSHVLFSIVDHYGGLLNFISSAYKVWIKTITIIFVKLLKKLILNQNYSLKVSEYIQQLMVLALLIWIMTGNSKLLNLTYLLSITFIICFALNCIIDILQYESKNWFNQIIFIISLLTLKVGKSDACFYFNGSSVNTHTTTYLLQNIV